MKANQQVRITKISGKSTSHLPLGTYVEGPAPYPPEIGRSFVIIDMISPMEVTQVIGTVKTRFDYFITTQVTEIREKMGGTYLRTKNSVWKLEEI